MNKSELREFLIDEAEYSEEEVMSMSNAELIGNWLEYEGIRGYTSDILDTIEEVYNVTLDD
jgi:hypothetical protein